GAVGTPVSHGRSVALSADGNSAIVGGYRDNGAAGAGWVFTRSGGVWTQASAKVVGSGAVGNAQQSVSVALSADGNSAIVGGFGDNNFAGAAWVFVLPSAAPRTATHDFNGEWTSDILWRQPSGQVATWMMSDASAWAGGSPGSADSAVWSIVGQRDFDGDGFADILWRNTGGQLLRCTH